jgi:hypothetical protein
MAKRYRIITDAYCGFELQSKSSWWPFWTMCSSPNSQFCNTFRTIEAAEAWAHVLASKFKINKVVKELGVLPRD